MIRTVTHLTLILQSFTFVRASIRITFDRMLSPAGSLARSPRSSVTFVHFFTFLSAQPLSSFSVPLFPFRSVPFPFPVSLLDLKFIATATAFGHPFIRLPLHCCHYQMLPLLDGRPPLCLCRCLCLSLCLCLSNPSLFLVLRFLWFPFLFLTPPGLAVLSPRCTAVPICPFSFYCDQSQCQCHFWFGCPAVLCVLLHVPFRHSPLHSFACCRCFALPTSSLHVPRQRRMMLSFCPVVTSGLSCASMRWAL